MPFVAWMCCVFTTGVVADVRIVWKKWGDVADFGDTLNEESTSYGQRAREDRRQSATCSLLWVKCLNLLKINRRHGKNVRGKSATIRRHDF
jgi:hypothetical protein